jgi:hypothetical protein
MDHSPPLIKHHRDSRQRYVAACTHWYCISSMYCRYTFLYIFDGQWPVGMRRDDDMQLPTTPHELQWLLLFQQYQLGISPRGGYAALFVPLPPHTHPPLEAWTAASSVAKTAKCFGFSLCPTTNPRWPLHPWENDHSILQSRKQRRVLLTISQCALCLAGILDPGDTYPIQ